MESLKSVYWEYLKSVMSKGKYMYPSYLLPKDSNEITRPDAVDLQPIMKKEFIQYIDQEIKEVESSDTKSKSPTELLKEIREKYIAIHADEKDGFVPTYPKNWQFKMGGIE